MEAIITANITANQQYSYDREFYGLKLDEWVQNAHKFNCSLNGWEHYPLKMGAYGYDNLAVCIGYTLTHREISALPTPLNDEHVDVLSKLIHEGWCANYIYWRDNEPYVNNNLYIKPFKRLDDSRRNMCAELEYNDLEQEEKDKDIILAKFIIDEINRVM